MLGRAPEKELLRASSVTSDVRLASVAGSDSLKRQPLRSAVRSALRLPTPEGRGPDSALALRSKTSRAVSWKSSAGRVPETAFWDKSSSVRRASAATPGADSSPVSDALASVRFARAVRLHTASGIAPARLTLRSSRPLTREPLVRQDSPAHSDAPCELRPHGSGAPQPDAGVFQARSRVRNASTSPHAVPNVVSVQFMPLMSTAVLGEEPQSHALPWTPSSDSAVRPLGTPPERALRESKSEVSAPRAPREVGSEPLKALAEASRDTSFVRLPRCAGSAPPRALDATLRLVRLRSSPTSVGREPSKALAARLNSVRLQSEPSFVGRVSFRAFTERSRTDRRVRPPTPDGRGPDSAAPLRLRRTSDVSCQSEAGSVAPGPTPLVTERLVTVKFSASQPTPPHSDAPSELRPHGSALPQVSEFTGVHAAARRSRAATSAHDVPTLVPFERAWGWGGGGGASARVRGRNRGEGRQRGPHGLFFGRERRA